MEGRGQSSGCDEQPDRLAEFETIYRALIDQHIFPELAKLAASKVLSGTQPSRPRYTSTPHSYPNQQLAKLCLWREESVVKRNWRVRTVTCCENPPATEQGRSTTSWHARSIRFPRPYHHLTSNFKLYPISHLKPTGTYTGQLTLPFRIYCPNFSLYHHSGLSAAGWGSTQPELENTML